MQYSNSSLIRRGQSNSEASASARSNSNQNGMLEGRSNNLNGTVAEKKKALQLLLADLSEEDRKLLLEELLRECDISSLEQVAEFISHLRVAQASVLSGGCGDPFSVLPHPITIKILSFLDPVSLCCCMRVSRTWRRSSSEQCLWKALCHRSRDYRLCSSDAERQQLARFTQGGNVRWKEAFGERYRLWSNWHAGRCTVRTLYGHSQGVVCVQFDQDRIASGSSDTTIRLWDLSETDGEGLHGHSLQGHSDTVRCLHMVGNTLASGSNDFNIKIWNLNMAQHWSLIGCRRTMIGHSNHVRCLEMSSCSLISGSYDATLKLWSLESGECVQTFTGHSDTVITLNYKEEEHRVVSGSSDLTIKMWDTRTQQNIMSIHNAHDSAVTCVRMDEYRIVSGSLDRMIKTWDLRTGKLMRTIDWRSAEGHTDVVRCLQVDSWRIVSSADDRTVKVWNLDTGERLCTLRDHTDGVTCVQFSDDRIVSGSFDKTVKVWDFGVI